MEKEQSPVEKAYVTIGATIAWIAVAGQLYLIILNRTMPVLQTLIRFISFYTILTNILVALCFTFLMLNNRSKWGAYFSRPPVLTAITVYIVVVGAVYNLILRFIWEPKGFQMIIDEMLHSLIPLVFLFYWLIFVPKNTLEWKNVFPWLIFPFLYCVYILIRGAISAEYPYPFMDVTELGYDKVMLNSGILTIVFFVLSIGFVGLGKLMSSRKHRAL